MLNCMSAVSGSASNLPSAPTQMVLGSGPTERSWAGVVAAVRITATKVRARANRVGREVGFMTSFRRVETGFVTAHDCTENRGTRRVPFWDEMRNQHRQPPIRAILPCQAEKNVTIISKAAIRLGTLACAACDGERTMRKWLVPLAVVGGLGAFFLSEKG